MIKYNPKLWFRHITDFHKSDTFRMLFLEMILVAAYTWGFTYLVYHFFPDFDTKLFKNAFTIHTLIGFIMGLLLVFRTNTAYDRWWEGRKLWGALVNNTRYAAIKVNTLLPDGTEKEEFILLIKAFPHALKNHLRDTKNDDDLNLPAQVIEKLKAYNHTPNGIITLMFNQLSKWKESQQISDIELLLLDKEIKNFIDILGACERIKNTPIPYSYTLFIKKFIFIYILSLPIGFISDFGYYTIGVTTFIFYVFVSIELIAEEIEDPFGTDDNDLPTSELSVMMNENIKELVAKD